MIACQDEEAFSFSLLGPMAQHQYKFSASSLSFVRLAVSSSHGPLALIFSSSPPRLELPLLLPLPVFSPPH